MNRLGILLLLAAMLAGCASEAPAATPTAIPAAPTVSSPPEAPSAQPTPPLPVAALTAVATAPAAPPTPQAPSIPTEHEDIRCAVLDMSEDVPPAIEEEMQEMGYAFLPSEPPQGFVFAGLYSTNDEVRQIYQSGEKNIIIAYPIEFSPHGTDPLGWERPQDAVSSLQIGSQTAYLMIGGWSDASIIAGPALKADRAEWDYDKSLALFFTCRIDGGRSVGMAIQASQAASEPINWIDIGDIVSIAQSLKRVSRSR